MGIFLSPKNVTTNVPKILDLKSFANRYVAKIDRIGCPCPVVGVLLFSAKVNIKVARYSFSRPIPPKFEHKLRRHKQSFGKIAPTVVLDKDENLL